MTATLTLTRPMRPFGLVARMLRRRPAQVAPRQTGAEQARARRAFVMDKLADNSEAFASEYDVQAMMACYPRDF